jgi:hypothetical protein
VISCHRGKIYWYTIYEGKRNKPLILVRDLAHIPQPVLVIHLFGIEVWHGEPAKMSIEERAKRRSSGDLDGVSHMELFEGRSDLHKKEGESKGERGRAWEEQKGEQESKRDMNFGGTLKRETGMTKLHQCCRHVGSRHACRLPRGRTLYNKVLAKIWEREGEGLLRIWDIQRRPEEQLQLWAWVCVRLRL